MSNPYRIEDTSTIVSPAMVIFFELVEKNFDEMLRIAGHPARLRPHCKTHKMRELAEMGVARGIVKAKCATFAEAEMLVAAGVTDIFLAYNLVGPNIPRAVKFRQKYPDVIFSVTGDHERPIRELGRAMAAAGTTIEVVLDVDTGLHRTGVELNSQALELYRLIANTPGLKPGGLHAYDGHNHQRDLQERTAAVMACWRPVAQFRDELLAAGLAVPRIVAGGTGSFPIFAQIDDPLIELGPGTVVFNDVGYSEYFPDMKFTPAALVLTRVVSRPTPQRITLDLGYKAIASDPPMEKRMSFPALPDAKLVLHNEEHLVIETSRANEYQPGDELLAIPRHVCPTSALHKQAFVIKNGKLAETWNVVARDRWLEV